MSTLHISWMLSSLPRAFSNFYLHIQVWNGGGAFLIFSASYPPSTLVWAPNFEGEKTFRSPVRLIHTTGQDFLPGPWGCATHSGNPGVGPGGGLRGVCARVLLVAPTDCLQQQASNESLPAVQKTSNWENQVDCAEHLCGTHLLNSSAGGGITLSFLTTSCVLFLLPFFPNFIFKMLFSKLPMHKYCIEPELWTFLRLFLDISYGRETSSGSWPVPRAGR